MRTKFGAFFHDTDRNLVAALNAELAQTDSGGQTGRAATYDNDIKLHRFSFHDTLLTINP
jgi:hypothetical protein